MGWKGLKQYRGRLDAAEVAAGMNAARRNAAALADEARLLLEHGRTARAASLAALSIEESGKDSILRALALARSDQEAAEEWRAYRRHTEKNRMWVLPAMAARGARSLRDFKELFASDADHNALLDQVKQIGFYSDCLGDRHWSDPAEAIDEALATQLVETAGLLAHREEVTTTEIELWVEVVGPVWKGPWMAQALTQWHRKLVEIGLRDGDPDAMEAFVFGDPRE